MDREFPEALDVLIESYLKAGTSREAILEALDLKLQAVQDEGDAGSDGDEDEDEDAAG